MKQQFNPLFVFFTCLVFCATWSHAQEGDPNGFIPNLFPVSPQAASLGKYIDLPVDISTGRINYQVPFYTIKEGGVKIPIYLSYNYSGLMVDEKSTTTGLGWNLQAGGVITRRVNGLPDESAQGYLSGSGTLVYNYVNNIMTNDEKNGFIVSVGNGNFDGEPDRFYINANGLSASFYFNHNGVPVFFPDSNLKVAYDLSNNTIHSFTVTDAMGNQYIFSDKDSVVSVSTGSGGPDNEYVSSWYLSKVIPYTTKTEIIFDYYNNTVLQNTTSRSKKKYLGYGPVDTNVLDTNVYTTFYEKVIKSITSINQTVTFSYSGVEKMLNQISATNQPTYTINFETDGSGGSIPLIKSILRESNTQSEPYYEFEYETGNLSTNSLKKDFLGFNNTSTLLTSSGIDYSIDFNKTKAGALKKITYPTQGYTHITYEQNAVDETTIVDRLNHIEPPCTHSFSFGKTVSDNTSQTFTSDPIDTGGLQRDSCELYLTYNLATNIAGTEVFLKLQQQDGTVVFNRQLTVEMIEPNEGSQTNASPTVRNTFLFSNNTRNQWEDIPTLLQDAINFQNADLGGLTAVIDFHVPNAPNSVNAPFASGSVSFSYSLEEEGTITEVPYPGIRVKQVETCTDGDCYMKQYTYRHSNGDPSGVAFAQPNFWSHESESKSNLISGGILEHRKWINLTSSSITPVASYSGNPVLYEYVQEKVMSDSGANIGKTAYTFSGRPKAAPILPYLDVPDFEWEDGKLRRKESYGVNGNPLRQEDNNYTRASNFLQQPLVYTFKSIQTKFFTGVIMNHPAVQYTVDSAHLNAASGSYHLNQQQHTTYYDNGNVVNTTSFTYDPNTLGVKQRLSTNSSGEIEKTEYFYPQDMGLTELIDQNRISQPVKTETYNNNELLSTTNTIYENWGNNVILPKKVQTLKGVASSTNQLEDRVTYHGYDDYGNPLEMSKPGDIRFIYIWGYGDTQPIAKIGNASYASLGTAQQSAIDAVKTASDNDTDATTEGALRTAFAALRAAFPDAMVTSYTYDPLIGVTSITDPKGDTVYYEYDAFNRLKLVKDQDGNIVSHNDYNYATQN